MTAPDFHDQFVLSQGPRPHPHGFRTVELSGWTLAAAPNLPITPLEVDGAQVGWILGWVVGPTGALLHEESDVKLPAHGVEDFIYQFSGRWAVVLLNESRIYLDPAGSLAVVFSEEGQVAASTVSVLRWNTPVESHRGSSSVLSPNQFFPAGLTSDPSVRRLLPNHYLNLETWHTVRHWGPPSRRVGSDEIGGEIATVMERLRVTITGLSNSARLILPLTAGRDGRMLLAAAKPVLNRCEFVTFEYRDSRQTDITAGRALAKQFDLPHTVLKLGQPTEKDKETYLRSIGYDANAGKARDYLLAARQMPRDRGWITGFGGEVGRAFYWTRENERHTPQSLLSRMKLPETDAHLKAIGDWLKGTDCVDGEALLDLLYLELRQGGWASPQFYGVAPFRFNVMPLNNRDIFSAMLSLPTEYRRKKLMASDVIRLGWTELSELPFGHAPGLRGRAQEAVAFGRKVTEHARRRVAGLGGSKW